jgi:sugar (pentulose or hexulose) kinase
MATAVIDIGKTNLKLVVLDEDGRELFLRKSPNAPLPGPPYLHHDVERTWSFVTAALAEAARAIPVRRIVTTTHGATGVLIDDDGLVLPAMDYEDPAPEKDDPGYASVRPAFDEALSPLLPFGLNFGRQLFWQSHRHPDAFARARHILTYPQYWSWRLSGVAVSEATSLGTHTDLWRPREGRWSSMVERLGWERLLPPLRPASAVLGPVKPGLASELGLDPVTEIISGIHDSNASLVPYLATRAQPFTVVSTGTWTIIFAVGSPVEGLDETMDTLANVDANGNPVATARFMGGREFETLAGKDAPSARLEDLAALVAAGRMTLPSFSPQGGPFAASEGRHVGPPPVTPAERSAAASLYLALMVEFCMEAAGCRGDVILEGPFARNAALLGALAALLPDRAVLASPDATGTSMGAGMVAGVRPPQAELPRAAPAAIAGLVEHRNRWREMLPKR